MGSKLRTLISICVFAAFFTAIPVFMVAQDANETEQDVVEESIENEAIDETVSENETEESVVAESDNSDEITQSTTTEEEKETATGEESTESDDIDNIESSELTESDTLSVEKDEKEVADTQESNPNQDTADAETAAEKSSENTEEIDEITSDDDIATSDITDSNDAAVSEKTETIESDTTNADGETDVSEVETASEEPTGSEQIEETETVEKESESAADVAVSNTPEKNIQKQLPKSSANNQNPMPAQTSNPGDGISIGGITTLERADVAFYQATPVGAYRQFSYAGLGFDMGAGFSIPALGKAVSWLEPAVFAVEIGFAFNVTSSEYYNSLTDMSWSLAAGYTFPIKEILDITPYLQYGGIIHFLKGDLQGTGTISNTAFYDQMLGIEIEIADIFPISTSFGIIDFFFTPGYHLFFEKGMTGQQITIRLGSRINF